MEEVELYHITCVDYQIGIIPAVAKTTFFHQATLNDERRWINDFLDDNRPHGAPSRRRSFYTCDSLANCKALKSTISKGGCSPKIFRVRMANHKKVPMALVTYLLNLGEGNTLNEKVATEYWNPTHDWKFYEYLSEEMEILDVVPGPQPDPMSQLTYWATNGANYLSEDLKLANQLFKQ